MSEKIKLEVEEEVEEFTDYKEPIKIENTESSEVVAKPEFQENFDPDETSELGDSVLYCIGGTISERTETGWSFRVISSISYMSGSLTNPDWVTIPWPRSRMDPGTVVHDHKLYIFGGHNRPEVEAFLDTIEVFDLPTKSWLPVGKLPFKMDGMGVCSFGDHIYIAGGWSSGPDEIGGMLRYYPISGRFEQMAKPSAMYYGQSLHALNGYLYSLPGNWERVWMERYDPVADQWSNVCYFKDGLEASSVVHKGKIYALSETHGLEAFCPLAQTWSWIADTPVPRSEWLGFNDRSGALASINGRLIAIGNRKFGNCVKIFEFDVEAAVWIRRGDMNFSRNQFLVAVYDPST